MKVKNWDIRTADNCKLYDLMGIEWCNNCRCLSYCEKEGKFMKQMTIFDIIPETTRDIPCGYIDDISLIGRELRFNELQGMIGKKVLLCSPRQSAIDYKVIKITDYWVDCDKVYKMVRPIPEGCLHYSDRVNDYIHDVCGQKEAMDCYELDYICDRVGFVDKDKNNQSDHFLSEMYCRNGRFDPMNEYADTFYELRY